MSSMRLQAFLLSVATVLLSSACTKSDSEVYRGVYTFGPEVEEFTPCGSAKTYWLAHSSKLEALKKRLGDSGELEALSPYPTIYIEFLGHEAHEQLDGFSVDYDGLLRLDSLSNYQIQAPADCQAPSP